MPSFAEFFKQATGPAAGGPATVHDGGDSTARQSLDEYAGRDGRVEPGYRGVPQEVTVGRISPDEALPDRSVPGSRRRRHSAHHGKPRSRLGPHLEFAEPVTGPLLLGHLSHLGYGVLVSAAT